MRPTIVAGVALIKPGRETNVIMTTDMSPFTRVSSLSPSAELNLPTLHPPLLACNTLFVNEQTGVLHYLISRRIALMLKRG